MGKYEKLDEFHKYFNSFYGGNADALYHVKHTTKKVINSAITILKFRNPNYEFKGDSFDREMIRDIVFADKELKDAYKR